MVLVSGEPPLNPATPFSQAQRDKLWRTVAPIGAYQLCGLACLSREQLAAYFPQTHFETAAPFVLIALDTIRGYLLQVDAASDNTTVLNPYQAPDFRDASGLWIDSRTDTLWFCQEEFVYVCSLPDLTPQRFTLLAYPVNGVAVQGETVYVSCQKSGYIHLYHRPTRNLLDKIPLPGVGTANLLLRDEELWLCDRIEQSVYCLNRQTGAQQCRILTPYEGPTALAFHPDPVTGQEILYVAYAGEEPYIRDNPNHPENPLEINFRDRTFMQPLDFCHRQGEPYTLSNGYLLEMSYIEELSTLEDVELERLENLEWRIALPANTHRQQLRQVEPIGLPFQEEQQDGQRVAVFHLPRIDRDEARLFGWKALVEVRGIKYLFTPDDVEDGPELTPEFQARYLVDNDELMMDSEVVRRAAQEAIGTETNLLRKMLKIRNYVYDRLSYQMRPRIDTPDVVLERGIGSCGEYVGVLLALARLNGIACRTVGRYKCPPRPEQRRVPLYPDYNHVWLEFYIPGFGWVPMESNPDDVIERGPYPTRFFMGLPWFHVEMAKGLKFETTSVRDQGIRMGDLALNHVRFSILDELPRL